MTRQQRALVVGGSMAGLFAALALRQRGWHVDVVERNATALADRGAGIATHDRLNGALAKLGLTIGDDLGIPIAVRRLYDRQGRLLREVPYPQVNTSWDCLFQRLRAAVPDHHYHLGRSVVDAATVNGQALATFADGSTATADLLVAADGFRSTVRERIAPAAQPEYAGYVAWRGLVEEAALSSAARGTLMSSFAFCLAPGEQMLGYPVAGAANRLTEGHRRFNFVWYRRADARSELPRLLTDEQGTRHTISVPPPLVAKAVVADMRAAAATTLAPAFVEAVAATAMPFFQPIYDFAVPSMVAGRIVLIGDAAFVARPHVGAGVTKAAEDALALAEALKEQRDVAIGLDAFDRERHPVGERIVQRGRHLGALLDQGAEAPTGHIDVMRDTASLSFLD